MKDNLASDLLRAEIEILEARKNQQICEIKNLTQKIREDLSPKTLVKDVFHEFISSKSIKRNTIDGAVGIGAGILVKSVMGIKSPGILRKLSGYVLQIITTKLVAKNMPVIINKILKP